MRAACGIADLRRAAAIAAKAAAARDDVPALSALKIVANSAISITGTDLKTWAITSAGGEITQECAVLARAKDVVAFCRNAPKDGQCELALYGTQLQLSCGRARAALPTIPVEDFPHPREAPDMREADKSFAAALDFCLPAVSTEVARYHLCGIFLAGDEAVATDGNRLHLAGAPGAPAGAILPATAAKLVADLLIDGGRFGVDGASWAAECGDIRLGGATLEGKYPDFKRVIGPAERSPVVAIADSDELAAAIRQASLGEIKVLRLAADGDCLSLSSTVTIRGASNAVGAAQCPAEIRTSIEVGVNSRYLAEALGSLPTGPVAIRHAPGMPIVFSPEEGSVFLDRRAAIMTMRV